MLRKELSQLLDDLGDTDLRLVWGYGCLIRGKLFLKRLNIFRHDFRPWRLLAIYGLALPLSILVYAPTPCEPEPQVPKMLIMSILTALSFYKLSPI